MAMADNEIVKALERMSEEDPNGFSNDVLDLVKRQKTEIDRLYKSRYWEQLERTPTVGMMVSKRLKEMHRHNTTSIVSLVTVFDNINKLFEEMTGGGEKDG